MTEYTRPYVEPVEFRDGAGSVIEYRNRWASLGGTPPDDSCSVDQHTERFAPLHTVAAALIDHLVSTYDVDLEEGKGSSVIAQMQHAPSAAKVVRAVRLIPRGGVCAADHRAHDLSIGVAGGRGSCSRPFIWCAVVMPAMRPGNRLRRNSNGRSSPS